MSKSACVPSRRILTLLTLVTGFALPLAAAAEARVSQSYGKLPLHFEANRGQTHGDVRFLARGPGYSLYLTPGEAVLVLARPSPDAKHDVHGKRDWRPKHKRRGAPAQATPVVLRMSIVGAAPAPLVSGLEELPGRANYIIGNDPAQWRTNVLTYAKVHYREIYPGIDLVYYGNQRQLEHDFVVAPGADPQKIVLDFQGAERLEIDAEGELVLHAAGGALRQRKPVIYQHVGGSRRKINGGYVLKGVSRVGFEVAAYDRSRSLVIDPTLSYSTYVGGGGSERAQAIAVDSDGNAYIAGYTSSIDYPTANAFQGTFGGGINPVGQVGEDAFVTKINPTGTELVYSTYLGGSGNDHASGIAVDAAGDAYVTGDTTSTNFPTTPGAFQSAFAGPGRGSDAFVTKLNATGSGLVYSTYLGGSCPDCFEEYDIATGIAVDTDGNVYVAGNTDSPNFPTTPGAFQPAIACCREHFGYRSEAFVTKLDFTGSILIYSTYLGGSGNDSAEGIAVDADRNAYVTGETDSTNFPTTEGAFQGTFGGFGPFVTKLNPSGSGLIYSTFLAGSGGDRSRGIAVDSLGNAYTTGYTGSIDYPTANAFQPAFAGASAGPPWDAFVSKLNSAGSGLVYSTYLGGSSYDLAHGIAVDAVGNAYVTGSTQSTDYPTVNAFQSTFAGGAADVFVTKFSPTGSPVYSTFLGGSGYDYGSAIAVDASGNAYVTGSTLSSNFPITPAAFQSTQAGDQDIFIAKITDVAPTPTTSSTPFRGTPFAIPGSFEAEDFDLGGEGVAYHDNVPGNAGGQYRPDEDVDIIASADSAGGGYVVHNFETGEWLAYTINVATSAQYDIELRVSSEFLNSAFHIEIDGVDVTGSVTAPNTGSWEIFQWVGKKGVALTAGQHVLKIFTDQQYFDLNSVRVLPSE